MNNATAVRATSEVCRSLCLGLSMLIISLQSVAVRVDAWKTKLSQKNPRGRSKSPPAPPKYATMGSKTPTASPRTGGKSPISRPEKESVPKVRGGAPASDKAADGEEEDAPVCQDIHHYDHQIYHDICFVQRPEPYTPPPESASMKVIYITSIHYLFNLKPQSGILAISLWSTKAIRSLPSISVSVSWVVKRESYDNFSSCSLCSD